MCKDAPKHNTNQHHAEVSAAARDPRMHSWAINAPQQGRPKKTVPERAVEGKQSSGNRCWRASASTGAFSPEMDLLCQEWSLSTTRCSRPESSEWAFPRPQLLFGRGMKNTWRRSLHRSRWFTAWTVCVLVFLSSYLCESVSQSLILSTFHSKDAVSIKKLIDIRLFSLTLYK